LLEEVQNEVLNNHAVEYAPEVFDDHRKNAFSRLRNQMAPMRQRKQKLEGELRRLTGMAAETVLNPGAPQDAGYLYAMHGEALSLQGDETVTGAFLACRVSTGDREKSPALLRDFII
jgi:hypothetical protein